LFFQKQLLALNNITFGKYKLTGPQNLLNALEGDHFNYYFNAIKVILNKTLDSRTKHSEKIIFIDVGANIGQTSLIFSQIDNSKVFSFEPYLESFDILNTNISNNTINNVITFPYGLFSEDKQIGMGPPLNVTLFKRFDKKSLGMKSIYTNSLDCKVTLKKGDNLSFIKELKKIHILKIDVEGAELGVLRGLKQTIKRHPPILLMEFSSYALHNASDSKKQLIDCIKGLGYKFVMNASDLINNKWERNLCIIDEYSFPEKGAPDLLFTDTNKY
jgi:FkbM family methyltransferase